jgi:hypothetical protein
MIPNFVITWGEIWIIRLVVVVVMVVGVKPTAKPNYS